jgi:hypothetical protein
VERKAPPSPRPDAAKTPARFSESAPPVAALSAAQEADMADNVFSAMAGATDSAVSSLARAAKELASEWADDFDDVKKGFDKGVAPGFIETLDAFSTGNLVQNTWTALGIIPDDDGSEALLKGVMNGLVLNPIAIKDFLDAGQAMEAPRDAAARQGRCMGRVDVPHVVKNGACFGGPAPTRNPPATCGTAARCDGVVGKRVKDTTIGDILADKSLCFEDMLALVMIHVVSQQQKEIAQKLALLDELNRQLDGAGAVDAPTDDGAARVAQKEAAVADAKERAKAEARAKARGEAEVCLDPAALAAVAGMIKPLLPVLMPAICGALACVPPMGPLLAMAAPVLLPMLLDQVIAASAGQKQGAGSNSSSSSSSSGGGAGKPDEETKESLERSRALEFEKLKMLVNRMSEMQQTLSNVLNTQHETSMAAIRNIRA